MKYLCDSNVFLALVLGAHPHHEKAINFMESLPHEECAFFCRATQTSFLRLLTTEAIMKKAVLTNRQAIETWKKLRKDVRVGFIYAEPEGMDGNWPGLAESDAASPKRWMDAYLAALAMGWNMQLVTFDRGFRYFQSKGLDLQVLS